MTKYKKKMKKKTKKKNEKKKNKKKDNITCMCMMYKICLLNTIFFFCYKINNEFAFVLYKTCI
jgi:hypothetical protein